MGWKPDPLAVIEVPIEQHKFSLGRAEIGVAPRPAVSDELAKALEQIAAEGLISPEIGSSESGDIVLRSGSELDLDQAIGKLRDEHGLLVIVGAPQIVYRETVSYSATVDYTHKRNWRNDPEFARLILKIAPAFDCDEPFAPGEAGRSFSPDLLEAVERGTVAALSAGPVSGFPLMNVRVSVQDYATHPTDSSPRVFAIAAHACARQAIASAGPVLMEPIMTVEVVTPDERGAAIVEDLRARRARIIDDRKDGEARRVAAYVGLSNMFGYPNTLASLTRRQATFEMRFDHYGPVAPMSDPGPFAPAAALR